MSAFSGNSHDLEPPGRSKVGILIRHGESCDTALMYQSDPSLTTGRLRGIQLFSLPGVRVFTYLYLARGGGRAFESGIVMFDSFEKEIQNHLSSYPFQTNQRELANRVFLYYFLQNQYYIFIEKEKPSLLVFQ